MGDFIPASLRRDYLISLPTEEDTTQTLIQKLQQLYHYRHDLIHYLCEKMMAIKSDFETIKKISDHFDELPAHLSNLSPDIVIEKNGFVTLIDISVSGNYEFNYNNKRDKYKPILIHLDSIGYSVNDFYMFWVDPAWSNLENAINNFKIYLESCSITFYTPSDRLIDELRMAHEMVSEKIQDIRLRTPVEALNFFDRVEAPTPDLISDLEYLNVCKVKYPKYEDTLNFIDNTSLEESETMFTNLVNDEEVRAILKDEKHDHLMYNRAFDKLKEVESNYTIGDSKPSFFIPYASYDEGITNLLNDRGKHNVEIVKDLKLEQKQIVNFLDFLTDFSNLKEYGWLSFGETMLENLKECLSSKNEKSIFNTGMLTGTLEDEMLLSKQYNEYRKTSKSSISKRTFFKNNMKENDLKDTLPYIYRNKCVKISRLNGSSFAFINKSGTSFKKTHEVREYKEKTTIEKGEYQHFNDFVDVLESPTNMPYNVHSFLGGPTGCDSQEMNSVKEMLLEEQRKFLGLVQHTHCHSMSRHSSLAATQLLHFNELNTTDNTYCMFTCGQPNILHIIRGGSIKRGADIGQAFFTIFITDNKKWCNPVYGKIDVIPFKRNQKQYYLCKTPWVRLTSERLSFMKDQYYSTLSTAYDTWARNKLFVGANGFFTHMYTFRMCISLAPSQRIAELLMDTRYIFMSALSTYSNVEKLILDKFAPPYKNVLEQYIVRQLEFKSQQVILYLTSNPPKPNKPGFSGKDRLNHTLGGQITLPSLWSNFVLQDLQSIFDDIFVYVHTSKEPSSEYHEQIKAMNTILKYQKEYDKLNEDMKFGTGNETVLKKWLLSESQVGCSASIIHNGTKLFAGKYSGLYKSWEFRSSCQEEPLSNIVSTKSCIPEYDRVETQVEHTKKTFDKVIKNIDSLMKSGKAKYIVNKRQVTKTFCVLDVNAEDTSEIVITGQNRVKVHDALIDWLNRFGMDRNYIIELATWNIRNNNSKVLTDTCIKAQYGAKREFYVINLGAKAMARVTENSYKSLSKVCKNEMISIPGDRKLTFIQQAINESILSSERRQDILMYVNGDCTKWSACETMASFISMNHGLKDVLGPTIYKYNMVTFSSWANKQIQIPQTILNNLRFISDSTRYLEDGTVINSTQNFLQGMFNYSSSIKAVISTEFALHMFKRNFPDKFLHCSHLEHSDDYSLIVRAKDLETFEEFRIYHKLSQKLFGINDSIKKTNIQKHIQEFISLFSFNGQLYYPFIKKTKEVGTNLPCTDYRSDVMSITSRVSEGIRIGLSLESAYFMQRVHCASLADAYSISPNMRNSVGTVSDIFSRPLELFGLPDTLPLISVVVKGSTDNYRIFNYGNEGQRNLVKSLFTLGQSTYDLLDLPISTIKEEMGELYNPRFSYPTRHNRIKDIRGQINFSYDDALGYFKNNLTDSIVKPVETKRFYQWLKSMYYNNSFVRAYMRVSRSAMTLRHSMFSSKPCILEIHSHMNNSKEVEKEYTTIRNFVSNFINEHSTFLKYFNSTQEKLLNNHLNCYNNCLELFYKMTSGSALVKRETVEIHTTVNKMPDPFKWLHLENNVSNLLQFLINPENFYKDRRVFISETSLGRDIKKLSNTYDIELLKNSPSYCRQIFSEITSQGTNRAYGLTFIGNVTDLSIFIRQYFEYGLLYDKTFNMIPMQKIELLNIKDGSHFFTRDWKTNLSIETGILSQLALVYRCIMLSSRDKLDSNLSNFLKIRIPELETTVYDFLNDMTIENLDKIQSGELTRKILSFLKSRMLNNSLDLQQFVKSKFYYDVYYSPIRLTLPPFKETATITFLGIKYRAYLYEEATKKYLFLEIKNTNRVYWFYCYSIAQRVFGMISQHELDERLLETKDFVLPIVPNELRYLLKEISLERFNPLFYKRMRNVFRQTNEWTQADLPVIVQDVRYNVNLPFKTERLNSSNIHTTEFSVYTGNVKLFKLPFGNLIYKNFFDENDPILQDILIDNIPLTYLIKENIVDPFLKSKLDIHISSDSVMKILPTVMDNISEKHKFPKTIPELNELFDLDLMSYKPNIDYDISNTTAQYRKRKTTSEKFNSRQDEDKLNEEYLLESIGMSQDLFKQKPIVVNEDKHKKMASLANLGNVDIELTSLDEMKAKTSDLPKTKPKMTDRDLEEERNIANFLFGIELNEPQETIMDDDDEEKIDTVVFDDSPHIEVKKEETLSDTKPFDLDLGGFGGLDSLKLLQAKRKEISQAAKPQDKSINELSSVKQETEMASLSIDTGDMFGLSGLLNLQKMKKVESTSPKEKNIGNTEIAGKSEIVEKPFEVNLSGFSGLDALKKMQSQKEKKPKDLKDEKTHDNSKLKKDLDYKTSPISIDIAGFPGMENLKLLQQQRKQETTPKKTEDKSDSSNTKLEESVIPTKVVTKEDKPEEPLIIGSQFSEEKMKSLFNFSFGNVGAPSIQDDSNLLESKKSTKKEEDIVPIITENISIGKQFDENYLMHMISTKMSEAVIENIDINVEDEIAQVIDQNEMISNVEIITEIDVTQTLSQIRARQMVEDYTNLVPLRKTTKGQLISERQLASIEENRDLFASLADLEEDEVGELFELPNETVEYERSMSSDSSSSDSEEITWYQLVPSTSIIEGTYNFDLKCIKSMMDLNEYLLKAIVDKDMEDIVTNKKDLSSVILLVNYIGLNLDRLKLSKSHKSLVRCIFYSLKNILRKDSYSMFAFTNNMGIKLKGDKINFFALKAFENKENAISIASKSPKINLEKQCVNCDTELHYLSAPLAQDDLEDFFDKGFKNNEFTRSTTLCNLLNELIPRLKKTEFKLKGAYDF